MTTNALPKYRLLTTAELEELEKEFIEFLIVNGIAADDWAKLKTESPNKAGQFLTLFSDVVFEGILRKTAYLEYRTTKELKVFQCLADKLVMVGISATHDAVVDFTDPDFIQTAMQAPPPGLKVYTKDKPYDKQRELELFEMTQAGCVITDGELFKVLCLGL